MFADIIKNLRKENCLTQAQLAEICNVTQQAVGTWETKGVLPDTKTVVLIANRFNLSTDYLLESNAKKDNENTEKWEFLKKILKNDTDSLEILSKAKITANGLELNDCIYPVADEDIILLQGIFAKIMREVKNGATRIEIHRKEPT